MSQSSDDVIVVKYRSTSEFIRNFTERRLSTSSAQLQVCLGIFRNTSCDCVDEFGVFKREGKAYKEGRKSEEYTRLVNILRIVTLDPVGRLLSRLLIPWSTPYKPGRTSAYFRFPFSANWLNRYIIARRQMFGGLGL